MNRPVALVYLARLAEGVEPMQRFAKSYVEHDPGVPHDLVIVFKGCEATAALATARSVFVSLPHTAIEVSDAGFDINAYLETARRLDYEYFCFANTFTEIEADLWLAALLRHVSLPGVGIAGAMGSYESLPDSMEVITKVIYLCRDVFLPYDELMAYYYGFVADDSCRLWSAGKEAAHAGRVSEPTEAAAPGSRRNAPFWKKWSGEFRRQLDERFRDKWQRRTGPGGDMETFSRFPAFPNPHIRSNGFMVARERLLGFDFGTIGAKIEACAFESGMDGLTARLRRAGLAGLVVGKDGRGYDVADWWRSGTFRLGDQGNLLLSDNQSRKFASMSPGARTTHVRFTWGDYLGKEPRGFPNLGVRFPIDHGVTGVPPTSV
jgi:hypothetical protein